MKVKAKTKKLIKSTIFIALKSVRELFRKLVVLKWRFFGATIGKNTIVHSSVYIGYPQNFKIGENSALNHGCFISSMKSVVIGDGVHIAPYCAIFDGDHKMPFTKGGNICKKIEIGSETWIGSHSVILKGVTIGKNVTVGAGSIVTKDVPDNSIVIGVPAKVVGQNEK